MSKTMECKTSIGTWVLKKPKAGPRNRAMVKAETEGGNYKLTILMMELLPKMVCERPDGIDKDVPIEQVLDDLEMETYDDLVVTAMSLIQFKEEIIKEEEKKT